MKSKNFNIVTEVAFVEKGNRQTIKTTTIDNPEGVGEKVYDTKFNYVSFSPFFKAQYEKERVAIFGLIGLRMDYLLSYESDFEYVRSMENDFNKYIFGLSAGGGIEVKVKQMGIKLESQYHHDFDYVLDTSMEVKNSALIFSLGAKYYFVSREE